MANINPLCSANGVSAPSTSSQSENVNEVIIPISHEYSSSPRSTQNTGTNSFGAPRQFPSQNHRTIPGPQQKLGPEPPDQMGMPMNTPFDMMSRDPFADFGPSRIGMRPFGSLSRRLNADRMADDNGFFDNLPAHFIQFMPNSFGYGTPEVIAKPKHQTQQQTERNASTSNQSKSQPESKTVCDASIQTDQLQPNQFPEAHNNSNGNEGKAPSNESNDEVSPLKQQNQPLNKVEHEQAPREQDSKKHISVERTIPIVIEGRTDSQARKSQDKGSTAAQRNLYIPPANEQHQQPPVAQTPQTVESINKIQSIQNDVLELMSRVETFSGTRQDKEYIYLDEMLTRNLLKLDTIDTNGKESIRLARKEAIKCIQTSINVLEAKAIKNEQAADADKNSDSQNQAALPAAEESGDGAIGANVD